jgi:phage shock protein PspC (stress-responsive transcriptional regulator)
MHDTADAGALPGGKGATMNRRLVRSRTDRMLGGVCGGLGAHFDADPVIFRLLFVLMTVMGGSGLLIYIVMVIVIPREPAPGPAAVLPAPAVPVDTVPVLDTPAVEGPPAAPPARSSRGLTAGIVLVVLGALFLMSNLGVFWWWKWKVFWPVVLIAVGLWMLVRRTGKV